MSIPSFLRKDGDTLYYNGDGEFVFIVPERFFEKGSDIALVVGEYVSLIGILNYAILRKESDPLNKNLKTFNFPTVFLTKPGKIEKIKNLKLYPSSEGEDYRLLKYSDNGVDQIVVSTKVPQDIAYVEEFFNLFVQTAKIPRTIPYDELYTYFMESIKLNGGSFGISSQLFGIIVSELCRDPNNINNPFRLSKAIDTDMNSYNPISIKTVPKLVSPFSAITSENWDEAVVSACMNKDNIKSTPLEKVLTD